eukprot:7379992-Prymnesium_polylepis.2
MRPGLAARSCVDKAEAKSFVSLRPFSRTLGLALLLTVSYWSEGNYMCRGCPDGALPLRFGAGAGRGSCLPAYRAPVCDTKNPRNIYRVPTVAA